MTALDMQMYLKQRTKRLENMESYPPDRTRSKSTDIFPSRPFGINQFC